MKTYAPHAIALLLLAACTQHDARVASAPAGRGVERAATVATAVAQREIETAPAPISMLETADVDLGKGVAIERQVGAQTSALKALTPVPPPKRVPPKPKPIVPPPPQPEPQPEPQIEPPAPPGPEPGVLPAPAPAPAIAPRKPKPLPLAPPTKTEEGAFPSTPAAVGATVGLLGLTVGAFSLTAGDTAPNVPFAVASLGVSLVGFTTAGVFLIVDAAKDDARKPAAASAQKPARPTVGITIGPATAVVGGSF